MPRGAVEDDLRSTGSIEPFKYLQLNTTGQLARFYLPVRREGITTWWWEWTHTLRVPIIDVNGQPVVETKTSKKDQSSYFAFVKAFLAQRICLGDPEVLRERRVDPDRCPMCAAARDGLQGAAPERRFSYLVVRYGLQGGDSVNLRKPLMAETMLWKLSQSMYDDLQRQKDEIRNLLGLDGDAAVSLDMADMVIQCTSGEFYRTEHKAPRRLAIDMHADIARYVDELLSDPANLPTDEQFQLACARTGVYDFMAADAKKAMGLWAQAERFGPDPAKWPAVAEMPAGADAADVDAKLNSLLQDDAPPPDTAPDDPWEEPGPAAGAERVPVTAGAPPAPAANFDDVWGDDEA